MVTKSRGDAPVPAIMLQGTGSDVGKSLLVAGICRAFARRGLRVRPFKPQNMSNNAAVTADGGEIGRAQALQARACNVATSVHMNPVLLKPQSDTGAQIVVQGQVLTHARARDYYRLKRDLLPRVLESFDLIGRDADLVVVEGAGSPAEVNLRASDIANMGFAQAARLPVLLVGDIDRGGVIASIVGTHALLDRGDRQWLQGYIINKFRGDVALFDPALAIIADHTGLNHYGTVTYWPGAHRLPPEDGVALSDPARYGRSGGATGRDGNDAGQNGGLGRKIRIAVPILPRISNFDDLDPLLAEADTEVLLIRPGMVIPGDCDVVLLPGSKSTLADLRELKVQGWDSDIIAHYRRGGHVIGLCGGYQMLGAMVHDPDGVEGAPGAEAGLGLLAVETVMRGRKTLRQTTARTTGFTDGMAGLCDGLPVQGYEIHMGVTTGQDCARGWLSQREAAAGVVGDVDAAPHDGARSADGRVMGCYLHGLFGNDGFRRAYLRGIDDRLSASGVAFEAGVDAALDELADHIEQCIDLDRIWALAQSRETMTDLIAGDMVHSMTDGSEHL